MNEVLRWIKENALVHVSLGHQTGLMPGQIRYDNFIAPAKIPGLVTEGLFACEQDYGDRGL